MFLQINVHFQLELMKSQIAGKANLRFLCKGGRELKSCFWPLNVDFFSKHDIFVLNVPKEGAGGWAIWDFLLLP